MSKAKRRFIREKEAKKLLSEFFKKAKIPPQQLPTLKPPIELAKMNNEEVFFINKKPIFAKSSNMFFPTLVSDELLSKMPKAVVNMGAVPHICSGADIMAPGIVYFNGAFDEEDIVVVFDEHHQKPIAITMAFYSVIEAEKLERGKILKNIHYIGDKLWNIIKQLSQVK